MGIHTMNNLTKFNRCSYTCAGVKGWYASPSSSDLFSEGPLHHPSRMGGEEGSVVLSRLALPLTTCGTSSTSMFPLRKSL